MKTIATFNHKAFYNAARPACAPFLPAYQCGLQAACGNVYRPHVPHWWKPAQNAELRQIQACTQHRKPHSELGQPCSAATIYKAYRYLLPVAQELPAAANPVALKNLLLSTKKQTDLSAHQYKPAVFIEKSFKCCCQLTAPVFSFGIVVLNTAITLQFCASIALIISF